MGNLYVYILVACVFVGGVLPMALALKEKTQGNPTLDTILLIENTLKSLDYYPSITQLWKALPRGVTYHNYKAAVQYLIDSRKVLYSKGELFWIFADTPKDFKLIMESREP